MADQQLQSLLDDEQWAEVNMLLDRAEQRDAQRSADEGASADSFDADELRELAARVARGDPVSLSKR